MLNVAHWTRAKQQISKHRWYPCCWWCSSCDAALYTEAQLGGSGLHYCVPAVLNPSSQAVCHEVGSWVQSVPNLESTITAHKKKTLELFRSFWKSKILSCARNYSFRGFLTEPHFQLLDVSERIAEAIEPSHNGALKASVLLWCPVALVESRDPTVWLQRREGRSALS